MKDENSGITNWYTHCDFCGAEFVASKWQDRTCPACLKKGAPTQSDPDYDSKVLAYNKRHGVYKTKAGKPSKRRGRKGKRK